MMLSFAEKNVTDYNRSLSYNIEADLGLSNTQSIK